MNNWHAPCREMFMDTFYASLALFSMKPELPWRLEVKWCPKNSKRCLWPEAPRAFTCTHVHTKAHICTNTHMHTHKWGALKTTRKMLARTYLKTWEPSQCKTPRAGGKEASHLALYHLTVCCRLLPPPNKFPELWNSVFIFVRFSALGCVLRS